MILFLLDRDRPNLIHAGGSDEPQGWNGRDHVGRCLPQMSSSKAAGDLVFGS
jgi:hypothetical protein